jgi:cyclophilin family peptidyl-prolyl cis-trans isomerase
VKLALISGSLRASLDFAGLGGYTATVTRRSDAATRKEMRMPKKKQSRSRARVQQAQPAHQVRSTTPEREPGLIDRLKKNPFSVLLGVIVVLSMVLSLAAEIVQSSKPQVIEPTPTLIVYPTSTPAAQATSATGATSTPQARVAPTTPTVQAAARKTYTAAPPMTIDVNKTYTATIVTAKGTIKLQLLPKVAPNTVNAFVFLAREGFYDGLTFHRVEDWVVQGGDPLGTGTGGPGYSLKSEFNATKHVTGTLAMARSDDPNSAGSQFYIVKSAASWLDGQYTVFGQTIEGMDVVTKLVRGDVMQKVTITEQ